MKRTISTLLFIAMLAGLASCGSTTLGGDDTDTSGDGTTTAAPAETSALDALPATRFDGETFTVLARTQYSYEFDVKEENGDLMNDAVYARNTAMEDRFGIDFKTVLENSAYGAQANEFNAKLKSSIMAGDGAYDLVAGYAATIPAIVADGIFMNWNDIDYVDQQAKWWSANVAEELTINGNCFMLAGDLSLALWRNMNCILYNKELAESFHTGDLYKMVDDGTWTFDTLMKLTENCYKDLNGDSTLSPEDQFGLTMEASTTTEMFLDAFEIKITVKGDDGFPQFAYDSERFINFVPRINQYIHESGTVFFPWGLTADYRACFTEGRALFYTGIIADIENFRGMEDDFGILPYPKYNEEQESYRSTSKDEFSVFMVPIDVKNAGMVGLVTEAMCIYSHEEVIPVFYEVVLKDKMSRDERSKDMIDLIRDSLTFDFGYLCNKALDGAGKLFVELVRNNSNNLVSKYDAKKAAYNAKLDAALEIYR